MQQTEYQTPLHTQCQAARIISRFGGPAMLRDALKQAGHPRGLNTIERWRSPASYHGTTNGLIPHLSIQAIKAAAKVAGIILTAEDWMPITLDECELTPPVQQARVQRDNQGRNRHIRARVYDDVFE